MSSKTLKNSKYSSGGYRPQGSRTKSKDSRKETLKSSNLAKKGSWNNVREQPNKTQNTSPLKQTKSIEAHLASSGTDDEPNYAKPTHNVKRKNKQHTIGKCSNTHMF